MQISTRIPLYIFLAALTLGVSARDLSQDEALRLREQGRIIPLEQLLELVAQRHPQSSLLEVELEEDDDQHERDCDFDDLLVAVGGEKSDERFLEEVG